MYLRDRYLKPLLRTLTARPDLAQCFRTIEIDIHYHMVPDLKMFSLYTKLLAICPNLTSIIGDPCIFFCPGDHDIPSCQESCVGKIANRLSGGLVHMYAHARIFIQQRELQKVLSGHTAWESWEISGCQKMYPPFLPPNWKNLKHLSILSIKDFQPNRDNGILPLGSLESLESLTLTNSSLNILKLVPDNKLIALTVETPDSYVSDWSSSANLKELWEYLSRGTGPSSRLKRLSISIPAQHAPLTEKWLSQTLSLAPNIRELRLSTHYNITQNSIVLKSDPDVEELSLQKQFPICAKLQKLSFMFPGWSHNELLVKLLSGDGAFPRLADLACFRSNVVVELIDDASWLPPWDPRFCRASKDSGARADRQLELELVGRRGMHRNSDMSMNWRTAHFRRDERAGYVR